MRHRPIMCFPAIVAALLVSVLVSLQPVAASTYTVNSTDDAVDQTPGNDTCLTAGGKCTLRAAVQEANAHAGPDTIVLPEGVFSLSLYGPSEDTGATGDLDVTQSLTVQGAGIDKTFIDGLVNDRIFDLLANIDFSISNLTLENGASSGGTGGGGINSISTGKITITSVHATKLFAGSGGAVYHLGSLDVIDSVLDFNTATGAGAGIFLSAVSGTVNITRSDLNSNWVSGIGGALFIAGDYTLNITDSDFDGNFAISGGAAGYLSLTAHLASIAGSNFTNNDGGTSIGGALYFSNNAGLTIDQCSFTGNQATSGGGAAYVSISAGNLTATQSSFTDNQSVSGIGGAAYLSIGGNVDLDKTDFSGNIGSSGGGAIYVSTTGQLTATDCNLSDNSSLTGVGGAAYLSVATNMTMSGSSITGNLSAAGGGGVYASIGGQLDLSDTTIDSNRVISGIGGGMYLSVSGSIDFANTLIAHNVSGGAGSGGGMYFSAGGSTTIVNSTIANNLTSGIGGGIYNGSNTTMTNVTFFGNSSALAGSAIYNSAGSLTLRNSIISNSFGDNCSGGVITSGNFNIDDDGSCLLAGLGDQSLDPILDFLADNGGPTQTVALLQTSAAIDAFSGNNCPATDQRGVSRPFDGDQDGTALCDIGAFEFNDACPDDPDKSAPGTCGCGIPDSDGNGNSITDCFSGSDLSEQLARLSSAVKKVKVLAKLSLTKKKIKAVKTLLNGEIVPFFDTWGSNVALTDPGQDAAALFNKMKKAVKGALKYKSPTFDDKKKKAISAIKKLSKLLVTT